MMIRQSRKSISMYLIRFNHFCSKKNTNFQMNIHEHVRNMHTGEEGMGMDTKSQKGVNLQHPDLTIVIEVQKKKHKLI